MSAPDTRAPLTGDAAREALTALVQSRAYDPCGLAAAILATGRVLVLPEPEPPEPACIELNARVLRDGPTFPRVAAEDARRIHAAGGCNCARREQP